MNERMIRFIELLNQMFELDKSDLDFGIYRILNIRRKEIQKFFTEGLPKQIRETLEPFAQGNKGELQQGTDLSALESDVYSALYNFFSRYYNEGDFISKRRYKEGVYAIPYEGEEVKLYWANQDQYYIKTSENFKDYTFTAGDYTVHFLLVDATTEQNNNKEDKNKKREFMLFTEDEEKYPGVKTFEYNEEEKTVNIRFIFDVPKEAEVKTDEEGKKKKKVDYSEKNKVEIKQWLSTQPTAVMLELLRITNPDAKAKDQISLLDKHLKTYVAKNTFDYFIHKDLGGFLTRELDFFIKNEVMHLDDLDTENEARVETYIAKVRAIKQVGRVIIKFLAQIENFQKKLWLKKKFVVETNWCITLDRIPEEYYDEIRQNKAQVQEWIDMYAIDLMQPDLEHTEPFSPVPTALFLKQNGNLVVDTKFFSEKFKNRLISSLEDLDKATNGLMIYSENFQALSLIEKKYTECIRGCYIDPPFNLGEEAEYLYKVDYKDSTWLSLLYDRVLLLKKLLCFDGSVFVRCSHDGNMILRQMMNEAYGIQNYRNEIILRRAEETKGDLNKQFDSIKSITVNYDNLYWYSKTPSARFSKIVKPISANKAKSHWHSFWKAMDRPTMRYEILGIDLTNHRGQWMWKKERAQKAVDNYQTYERDFAPKGISLDDYWEKTGKILEFVKRDGNKIGNIKYWIPPRVETMADTNWLDIKGYANKWGFKTENSEGVLKRVIESLSLEGDYMIDFFLGSGTTAAVSLKLSRKFIGVDMADQFYKVALPRIKYVLNGETSGISKECTYRGGGIVKYLRLEQYEDALNNIQLKKDESLASLFGDDYTINYMLDFEAKGSLLNLDAFKAPFSYEMNITEKNEMKLRKVDVCETFNYLIGLTVKHQGIIRTYDSLPAAKPMYEGAVDLVKGTQFAFRQIEGTLPDGRKALVIWRTISDDLMASNAALDAYFEKYRINPFDREYDIIYVNGDNNLENLRTSDESWKVVLTEQEFNKRMFEEM